MKGNMKPVDFHEKPGRFHPDMKNRHDKHWLL
jgi:hypothetical protein